MGDVFGTRGVDGPSEPATRSSTRLGTRGGADLHGHVDGLDYSAATAIGAPGLPEPWDVVAEYSTDRLGRSLGGLVEIVDRLRDQGIQFKSLTEPLGTTDHGGESFFHIMAAIAHMQRRQVSEKTRAGSAAAKARGRLAVGRR